MFAFSRFLSASNAASLVSLLLMLLLIITPSVTWSKDERVVDTRAVRCLDEKAKKQEPWQSRCYDGSVTLENYNTPESIEKRFKANFLSKVIQNATGVQDRDASGQYVDAQQIAGITLFLYLGGHLGWAHDVAELSEDIRLTGPVFQGQGFDTHQRVRVFYSDEVVDWLGNGRAGDIPDGAMIVKQMYASNPLDGTYGGDRVSGWAVMVRNKNISKDGWVWYLYFFPHSPPYNSPIPVFYAQTGDSFCLACHGAADTKMNTFVTINNLKGANQQYSWIPEAYGPVANPDNSKGYSSGDQNAAAKRLFETFANGLARMQHLGGMTEDQANQMRDKSQTDFLAAVKAEMAKLEKISLPERVDFINSILDNEMDKLSGLRDSAVASSTKDFEKLMAQALKQLGAALGNHKIDEFLNFALEDYFRFIMQRKNGDPLTQPNPSILTAYAGAKTKLPATEIDVAQLPLDYIFTHTPALPKELPEDICAMHNGKKSTGKDAMVDCRDTFITADNCQGCHWNYVLQGKAVPNMQVQGKPGDAGEKAVEYWDISPFGEWGASPMGLAGRDPIFLAQLSWERETHPELANKISNLCLRCHQAGAQRQFHLDMGDHKDPAIITPPGIVDGLPKFSEEYTYLEPSSKIDQQTKWGALARDGVTCTVCHQIEPEGLGTEETFTAQFNFPEKPDVLYGPYKDSVVKPYLMEQALGLTPVYGEHMKESELCGSCHTVITPIVSEHADLHAESDGKYRSTYEQATYPEWLNSQYASGKTRQTCQNCHMPSRVPDDMDESAGGITEIIANVETAYLPDLDNRAADDLITPLAKTEFRRHTLVGLNMFINQMFQQFPGLLGTTASNPGSLPHYKPLVLAEKEMDRFAKHESVDFTVEANKRYTNDNQYAFDVNVVNKVGHKFPTGVGFRRAFLSFTALNEDGNVVWRSGHTNDVGQILDGDGNVLESEMTRDPLKIETGEPVIRSEDDAYIFEERTATWKHRDLERIGTEKFDLGEMVLTTSFLEIVREVKDTRLLPLGWKKGGDYAKHTHLTELDVAKRTSQPFYPDTPGKRTIRYEIPKVAGSIAEVKVTMFYQSIPPYYLQDRLQVDTDATRKLYYLVSHMNTKDTLIENWSITMGQQTLELGATNSED